MLRRLDWLTLLCLAGLGGGCGEVTLGPSAPDASPGTARDAAPESDAAPGDPLTDAGGPDASPPVPIDPSLIAWYPLDTIDDGWSEDATGNGHHAQCVSVSGNAGCPALVAGQIGMAMDFDEDGHLRVDGSDGFFDTTGGFTVAAWAWLEPPFESAPLSKMLGTGSGNSWQFEYADTGEPAFTTTNVDSKRVDYDDTPVEPATWVHLAGTWDGTTKRFYVNGALRFEVDFVVDFDGSDFLIGGDENGGVPALMFGGRVDDVRIYDRALDGAEILALSRAR
jgi:hypothetical protein